MKGLFRFLISLLIVIGMVGAAHAAIPTEERNALIDLYNDTTGAGWTDSTNWLGAPGTEDTWYGVSVVSDHVVQIDLSNNNLAGTIPTTIGDLTELTELYLFQNLLVLAWGP